MQKTSINLESDVLTRINKVVIGSVNYVDRSHFIRVAIDNELKKAEGEQ
jgi:metal-responsive CopG/Arc/MetJ family transcriptional regulator